ncbi:MAG: preprotein translocase subunit SecY [Thermoflexales bacterium]|nr:preprotein translocase subunit SecY [Thermoflexales bacterium]
MIQAVRNAFGLPDVRRKILFTLLILAIYRLAAHIPVPGVDHVALNQLMQSGSGTGTLFNILDLLSGGAIANFSVLAMGVYPYITATIIMQLLQPIIPQLEALAKEGEAGRNKINQYSYYLTIPLAALQAITQARLLTSSTGGMPILPDFGFSGPQLLPTISIITTMTAGTMFAIWLGDLITQEGVGNGLSIIIFGGIVARLPNNVLDLLVDPVHRWTSLAAFIIIVAATIAVIVIAQEGQRRIPVQYGKRVRGRKVYGGGSTHIPLRVNTAGMIPLIFAQSFMTFPAIIAQFFVTSEGIVGSLANNVVRIFAGYTGWYWMIYFLLVVGFTYFYTDVLVQQQDLPGMLQKQGGFIPGIRPGKRTEEYVNGVMRRITLVGALFLGFVAILPYLVQLTGFIPQATQFSILSTGLLIVVGVVIDTMRQLEAQLVMRHYEGFIK